MTDVPALSLAEYDRLKFALADLLRAVAVLRPRQPGDRDEPVRELFARIAEDRFNLVVVGRFSRGKSSLMNAIIGGDWLPTGIAPLTSVVTAVSYGSEAGVELTFHDRGWRQRVGLGELEQFVTQSGNPGNVKRLKSAEIQLPAEILRRGFYFIDTPGLGSPVRENTRTTEAFLPEGDAFLLVTSFDGPLSAEEAQVVEAIAPTGRRLFVAVNKQDTTQEASRERVLHYVQEQMTCAGFGAPVQVFATSATEALAAKLGGDATRLAASGVPDLEAALVDFLVDQKSREFLANLSGRIEELAGTLADAEARHDVLDRINEVRRQIGDRAPATTGGLTGRVGAERAGGCEVCGAMQAANFEHLRHLQYDLTVSAPVRRALTDEGGLCPLHTWWYDRIASPLGVCVGYADLLEAWAGLLAELAQKGGAGDELAAVIRTRAADAETCQVCRACGEAEQRRLRKIADDLDNGREAATLSAICIPHLAALMQRIATEEARGALLARQAGLLARVAEDMKGYAVKFDGLRRGLLSGAEHDAAARGLRLLAGLPNVSFAAKPE